MVGVIRLINDVSDVSVVLHVEFVNLDSAQGQDVALLEAYWSIIFFRVYFGSMCTRASVSPAHRYGRAKGRDKPNSDSRRLNDSCTINIISPESILSTIAFLVQITMIQYIYFAERLIHARYR